MSHSEASESGKADSGRTTGQADGSGSTTDTATNSSNNTTVSPQQWTTIPFRRAPATRGRGGSAARANYNPVNRAVNTRGRGTWNNGPSGRAPAGPINPGYTAAMSSKNWSNGPRRGAPSAFTTPRSTAHAYRERPGPQYAPTETTAPGSTARAYQGSTPRPPTGGWTSLNRFVTGRTPTPAPTQTIAVEEPSCAPRTSVAAEATMEVFHNTSTNRAATEPVIQWAAVGEPTNERAKAATDAQPEPNIEILGNSHSLKNPLVVSVYSNFQEHFRLISLCWKAYEPLMPRKSWNQSGQEANVSVNSHRVISFPDKKIYQYDVSDIQNAVGKSVRVRGHTNTIH